MSRKAAWARAEQLLNEVGIPEPARRINSYPHELSGGQQQRVMIAMAIACEPKLLIADEPTTAPLMSPSRNRSLELLLPLQRKHGMAILFITHDLALVKEIASHVVVMQHGEIKEQGPAERVRSAASRLHPRLARLPADAGQTPDAPAGGGRFIHGHDKHLPTAERQRGVSPSDPILLEVKNLNKTFSSRVGLFGKHELAAVGMSRSNSPRAKPSASSANPAPANHARQIAAAAVSGAGRRSQFAGRNLLALSDREFLPYKKKAANHLPESHASLNPRFTVGQIRWNRC